MNHKWTAKKILSSLSLRLTSYESKTNRKSKQCNACIALTLHVQPSYRDDAGNRWWHDASCSSWWTNEWFKQNG